MTLAERDLRVLLDAYRDEFLQECLSMGMTDAEATDCRDDFERENLTVRKADS